MLIRNIKKIIPNLSSSQCNTHSIRNWIFRCGFEEHLSIHQQHPQPIFELDQFGSISSIFTMIADRHLLLLLPLAMAMVILSLSIDLANAGIPVPEEFFPLQLVDHLGAAASKTETDTEDDDGEVLFWTQRYYTYGKHFQGPGHPIFLILGGEGDISPETGIFYPFVADHLAKTFGGFVLQPEHRFYGKSQPLLGRKAKVNTTKNATVAEEDPRVKLFTSEQALHDAMVLLKEIRTDLGCSSSFSSPNYCPVVTVGGSYPGFLSAFARILFPDIVDMAYAASAPMGFYAQETDRFAYYNHITAVAEETLPGCSNAVKTALLQVNAGIAQSQNIEDLESVASEVGICEGSIPDYVFEHNDDDGHDGFQTTTMTNELMMVVGYSFANDNMASYPPGKDTRLYKACQIFSSKDLSSTEKVRRFLTKRLHQQQQQQHSRIHPFSSSSLRASSPQTQSSSTSITNTTLACWKMTDQLPTGPNATISGGDWSGDGTGANGESWDFQTCTLLVEAIGFSENDSMFPPRDWTLDWMGEHCQKRFGVEPRPYELVRRFRFGSGDLASTNATRILFTNGLKVS